MSDWLVGSMTGPSASATLYPTRTGRLVYRAAMLSALVIAALQMFRVRAGMLTDYGADVLGTAWLYAMTRLGWTVFQRRRPTTALIAAAIVFALCVISELGQRAGVVPGRYDPYDIVAFAIGISACLVLERALGSFVAPPTRAPPN